jgi:hypothetical protein
MKRKIVQAVGPARLLIGLALMTVIGMPLAAWADTQPPITITLDQPLHFQANDGTDVVAEQGEHDVKALAGGQIQLQAKDKEPVFMQAVAGSHGETIDTATALMVVDQQNPDLIHVLLLQRDGQFLDAVGSVSGVQTRAATPSQALTYPTKICVTFPCPGNWPSGWITTPKGGTVVKGKVLIDVYASATGPVQNVQILVDGSTAFCALEKTAPYTCNLDTGKVKDGVHALSAVIRDTANNAVATAAVAMTVQNQGLAMPPAPPLPVSGKPDGQKCLTSSDCASGRCAFYFQPRPSDLFEVVFQQKGLNGYDFASSADRVVSLDYNGDKKQDLFIYRPGQGIAWVLQSNGNGTFTTVQATRGIAGFDLANGADRAVAFDFNGDGKDDLFIYRPGQGIAYVLQSNGNGTFTAVQMTHGIAGYDLANLADRAVALDFNGDGKDDLFLYRPGAGSQAWLLQSNGNGTFTTVQSTRGISGYDLANPADRAVALDFNGDGKDDLFLYRPGAGSQAWLLQSNGNGTFTTVQSTQGIAGYDLASGADRAVAFDYDGDGRGDLFLYRPGAGGTTWVLRSNGNGTFEIKGAGQGIGAYDFAGSTDEVIKLDYDGDRTDGLFVFRPGQGTVALFRQVADPVGRNYCISPGAHCPRPNTAGAQYGERYTRPFDSTTYTCWVGDNTWIPLSSRGNGQQCLDGSDCISRYCWVHPDLKYYCMDSQLRCAWPQVAGAQWGERRQVNGETYQCSPVGNMNWVNVKCPTTEFRILNACRIANGPNFCPVSYPVSTGVGSARDCSGKDVLGNIDCQRLRESEKLVGKTYQLELEKSADIARRTANPIPPNIYEQLKCFFEPVVFEGMKYTSNYNPDGRLNAILSCIAGGAAGSVVVGPVGTVAGCLAGVLAGPSGWQDLAYYGGPDFTLFGGPDNKPPTAITLGPDIITFRNQGDAADNPILWAHELEHTRQFRQLGNEGFADMYAYRADIIESDARKKERYVCDQLAKLKPPIGITDCRTDYTCKIDVKVTPSYCETIKP